MLIVGPRHLQAVLDEYVALYNRRRPHRARNLRPPDSGDQHGDGADMTPEGSVGLELTILAEGALACLQSTCYVSNARIPSGSSKGRTALGDGVTDLALRRSRWRSRWQLTAILYGPYY